MSNNVVNAYRFAGASVDLSDLKTYWKFNELDGGEVKNVATAIGSTDSLGTNADCSVNGMTIDGSSASPFGYAGAFDGLNDYLSVGTSTSQFNFMHNATMVWSINYWFYSNIGTVQQVFDTMSDTSGSNRGYSHSLPPSSAGDDDLGWACGIYTGTPPNYPIAMEDLGSIFSEGDWHMSTGTLDYSLGSDNLKYYADGSEEGTTTQGYTGDNGNAQFAGEIGARAADARWMNGGICEMSIWNRVLTPEEITALYNGGSGLALG